MAKVEATAVMTAHSALGKEPMSLLIEQAMIAAVEKCAADGIADPAEVRKAMLEARDALLR